MNRELVMLAKDFDQRDEYGGHYMSIKLDGQRAWWDGGISRGMAKTEIPWANTAKDERYKVAPVATGLWTRYGNVIHAPNWFLDSLPEGVFLDGELYLGRGQFQALRKAVSPIEATELWRNVKYYVFDAPSPRLIFENGKINNPQMTKFIHEETCLDVLRRKIAKPDFRTRDFRQTLDYVKGLRLGANCVLHEQYLLPMDEAKAKLIVEEALVKETSLGGEGLMLRKPYSIWHPKRGRDLLKLKKLQVEEGVVKGFITGDDGKLLGMMGALVVEWEGKTFNMSGFTDAERAFTNSEAVAWAHANPKQLCPDWIETKFKRGSPIRFTYMTKTDDGYPREPRHCRT